MPLQIVGCPGLVPASRQAFHQRRAGRPWLRRLTPVALALALPALAGACSLLPVDILIPRLSCTDGDVPAPTDLSPVLRTNARACIYDAVVAAVERDYVHADAPFIGRWRREAAETRAAVLGAPGDDGFYKGLAALVAGIGNGHTSFFPPSVAARQTATYEGRTRTPTFGWVSEPVPGGILVTATVPGGPAARAGLKRGDVITAVDGRPCGSDCIGAITSPVTLTVRSGRKVWTVPAGPEPITGFAPVEVSRIGRAGSVLLVTIPNFFTPNIAPEFRAKVERALDEAPLSALVIDVRHNPGGLAEPLDEILGSLLPSGVYGFHMTRAGEKRARMVRERDLFRRLKDLKLRVLIDAETHSAAELFASMLQQQGRAVLVGSPSAGVAERISVYNLPGGSRLSVAQAEFHTLNGVPVSKARVRPDVPSDPDWYRAGAQEDPTIRAALRSLD